MDPTPEVSAFCKIPKNEWLTLVSSLSDRGAAVP